MINFKGVEYMVQTTVKPSSLITNWNFQSHIYIQIQPQWCAKA